MIVVDTHTLIWAVQDDRQLGRQAAATIQDSARTGILIPAICAWEIGLVERRGAVTFPGGGLAWLRAILESPAFLLAELKPEIAIATAALDWAHRDPADRMIVATARHWDCPLLTADRAILAYAADGYVEAIDARH